MTKVGVDRAGWRNRQAGGAVRGFLALALLALPAFLGPLMRLVGRGIPLDFFSAGDRYMFRVLDQAGIYVLLALGLNIVVGYAGLLDLGYVAFDAVGAYTYALLASPELRLQAQIWQLSYRAHLVTDPL